MAVLRLPAVLMHPEAGACRVQLGVARFHNGAAFGALAETSFSPGPCATR